MSQKPELQWDTKKNIFEWAGKNLVIIYKESRLLKKGYHVTSGALNYLQETVMLAVNIKHFVFFLFTK